MRETLIERLVDRVTRYPAHIVEILAAAITFGVILTHMGPRGPANAAVNAAIGAALMVALLRYSGWAEGLAARLRLGPHDRIHGKIRLSDFDLFHEVTIDGDANRVWRRLADVRIRPAEAGATDIYDILIDPVSHGMRDQHQIFHVMLYRHNDDKTWPIDIIFEEGIVEFHFRTIDQDIPSITINLRKGPRTIPLRRTGPAHTAPPPEPAAPEFQATTPYDRIARAIIGRGPRSQREVGILRRKVGKALHPDRGTSEERRDREEAMKRANVYLDQFKP